MELSCIRPAGCPSAHVSSNLASRPFNTLRSGPGYMGCLPTCSKNGVFAYLQLRAASVNSGEECGGTDALCNHDDPKPTASESRESNDQIKKQTNHHQQRQ